MNALGTELVDAKLATSVSMRYIGAEQVDALLHAEVDEQREGQAADR